jgi:Leucine-rich repeat (LRR) protein
MGAWGTSSNKKSSCDDLLVRLERNDPLLTDVTILSTKAFGDEELNRLSAILETATEVLHLQSFGASGHAVSASALCRFGAALAWASRAGFSKLSTLALGDTSMGDKGISAFVGGVLSFEDDDENESSRQCTSLEHLDFSYKGMTIEGFFALTSLCEACPNVNILNLSRNNFSWKKNVSLPAEDIFQNVVRLDLSDCQIDAKFARNILPLLDYTDFSGSGSESTTETATPKDEKRWTIKPPRTIQLQNNPLGDKGFKYLLKLGRLDGIHVSSCQLSDAAIIAFTTASSSGLSECKVLDLSNNNLTAAGMTVLTDCLKRRYISVLLPQLTDINISGNKGIGLDGIQALLPGLAGRVLHTCDFSETECGGPGALLAIVAAQKEYCCTMHSLRLFSNKIGSNGFYKIAEILANLLVSSQLQTLDLAGNNAGQASVVELLNAVLEALERTVTKSGKSTLALKCLVIGGNQGGFDVEATVKQIHSIRPELDIARDKKSQTR